MTDVAGPASNAVSNEDGRSTGKPLNAGDFRIWLNKAFNGLAEVRVITILGDVTVQLTEKENKLTSDLQFGDVRTDAIVTVFNLADGDAINIVSPALKDDTTLREFHASQVESSLKALPANIAAVVELGKAIVDRL